MLFLYIYGQMRNSVKKTKGGTKNMKIKVGDKYGRWTVLKIGVRNPQSKAKNPPLMAYCQCECGTTRYKEYRALYAGRSLSCGCLKGEKLAERNMKRSSVKIGNQYGFLKVVEDLGLRTQKRGRNEKWFRCKCLNCGNENVEVSGNNLQTGGTKSCGCISSYGEKIIIQYLKKKNINYASQYTFPDLLSANGYRLRFDFAIFKDNKLSCLIEFDGRQHTKGPEGKWNHSASLEEIQFNDNLKNAYCKKNNIKLIRISYEQIKDLESILDNKLAYLFHDFIEVR